MNKNLYRIIFSEARGMFIAVAETTKSKTKQAGQGGQPDVSEISAHSVSQTHYKKLNRLNFSVALSLGALIVSIPLNTLAGSQIVADASAPHNQQATILNTGNGTPQVNIQTPSAGGVSRNTYSQFDVGQQGVVLNNSRNNVQSQLGGWVQGNPWLAKGEASVILNEVNSSNPSQLKGYVEVAGQRAQVVIANPSGLVCDGCGVINADRFTLTTGQAVMNQGYLESFLIREGQITLQGKGLNGSLTPYTDIYAQALKANAGLYANQLSVVLGQNDIKTQPQDLPSVITATDSKKAQPEFALDIAQLGGMYAQKIYLIGTEKGVGVRNAGNINSTDSTLTLKANGDFVQTGSIISNKEQLTISADHIANSGNIGSTQHKVDLSANAIQNSGLITTLDEVSINSAGQLNNDGGVINAGRIQISASELKNKQGNIQQIGGQKLAVNTATLNNTQGHIGQRIEQKGTGTPTVPVSPEVNQPDKLSTSQDSSVITVVSTPETNIRTFADGLIQIKGHTDNTSGKIINNNDIKLNATQGIDNTRGKIQLPQLNFTGQQFNNQQGEIYSQSIYLNAGQIDNTEGSLIAAHQLDIQAQQVNNQKGLLQAGDALKITAESLLNNAGGKIIADKEIELQSGALNNQSGILASVNDTIQITAGDIDSSAGQISAKDVTIQAKSLNNAGGTIHAQQNNIQLNVDRINNAPKVDQTGQIIASKNVAIKGLDFNNAGQVYAGDTLSVQVTDVQQNGQLAAGKQLTVQADSIHSNQTSQWLSGLDSEGKLQQTSSTLFVAAGDLQIAGTLLSSGEMQLKAGSANLSGSKASAENISIQAPVLNASDATLIATHDLAVQATQKIDNIRGYISAEQLLLQTVELNNNQGIIQHTGTKDFKLNLSGDLNNASGKMISKAGHAEISAANIYSASGEIQQLGQQLDITAQQLQLQKGTLQTQGQLNVHASATDLSGATVSGAGIDISASKLLNNTAVLVQTDQKKQLNLNIDGELGNTSGIISAAGSAQIHSKNLNNQQGLIQVENNNQLVMNIAALDNAQGKIIASGEATINTAQINNHKGVIYAAQALDIASQQAVENREGTIASTQSIQMAAQSVDNSAGFIQSEKNNIHITTQNELLNAQGQIRAGQHLVLNTGKLDNQKGQLIADQSITLGSAELNNEQGQIYAAKQLDGTVAGALNNHQGLIAAQQALRLTADTAVNTDGQIRSEGDTVQLTVSGDLNNTRGLIFSKDQMTLQSGLLDSTQGKIVAIGDLQISSDDLVNDTGVIYSDQNIDLNAQAFSNQKASLSAQQNINASVASLNNQKGDISTANGSIDLGVADVLDNATGKIIAKQALSIHAGDIDNTQGQLVANTGGDIETRNSLVNQDGTIFAHEDLTIKTGPGQLVIDPRPEPQIAYRSLSYNSDAIPESGHDGEVNYGRSDSGYLSGPVLDNQQGQIIAETGNLSIDAGAKVDNTTGYIYGHDQLQLKAGLLNNQRGQIVSHNQGNIQSQGGIDNTEGLLYSENQLNIKVDGPDIYYPPVEVASLAMYRNILANEGDATAEYAVTEPQLDAVNESYVTDPVDFSLHNDNGTIISKNDSVNISVANQLVNTQGLISAHNQLQIDRANLSNQDGKILSNQSMLMNLQSISNNQQGLIYSKFPVEIYASREIDNQQGQLISEQGLTLNADSINNIQGVIQAQQEGINLYANWSLNNYLGEIYAMKAINGYANSIDNTSGKISSSATVDLGAYSLYNHQGTIYANDTLNINGYGYINNQAGLLAAKNAVAVKTGYLDNASGQIRSEQKGLNLNVQGYVSNQSGELLAAEDLKLTAQNVSSVKGKIISDQSITLNITTLDNTEAVIYAKNQLGITATGVVTNDKGTIAANQQVILNTGGLFNQSGLIRSEQNALKLTSDGMINNQSGEISALEAMDIQAKSIEASDGKWISGDQLNISALDMNNSRGTAYAEKELSINTTGQLNNTAGILASKQQLGITAGSLNNNAGKLRSEQSGLMVNAQQHISNAEGEIYAQKAVTVKASSINNNHGQISSLSSVEMGVDELSNQKGTIYAADTLNIDGAGSISNQEGLIVAKNAVAVNTDALDNTHGQIRSEQKGLTLTTKGAVTNDSGELLAAENLKLTAQDVRSVQGKIISDQSIAMNVASLNNTEAVVYAKDQLGITATGAVNNNKGTIAANQHVALSTGGLINTAGQIRSGQNALTLISSGNVNNQSGEISALKAMDIQAKGIEAADGKWISGDSLSINASDMNNSRGTVYAEKELSINTTGQLNNTAGILVSKQQLGITAGSLNNDAGKLRSEQSGLSINAQQNISNIKGEIYAQKGINAKTSWINNNDGQISSLSAIDLDVNDLGNKKGMIYATDTLNIDGTGYVDNIQGTLSAEKALTVKTGRLNNTDGGKIYAGESADLVTEQFYNAQGEIYTEADLTLKAKDAQNQSGKIAARKQAEITVQDNAFNNQQGSVIARQVDLNALGLKNQAGLIQGEQSVRLDLGNSDLINTDAGQQGGILSQGTLTVENAQLIDNRAGFIASGDQQALHVQRLYNQAGQIQSNRDLSILQLQNGGELYNSDGGKIQAQGNIQLVSDKLYNSGTGSHIAANENLTIQAIQVYNDYNKDAQAIGGLDAKNIEIHADSLSNQSGAIRATEQGLLLIKDTLNNKNGSISSLDRLVIGDSGKTLNIWNDNGEILAKNKLSISANYYFDAGKIISLGDMELALKQSYVYDGKNEVAVNGNLKISSDQDIFNLKELKAGKTLELNAQNINNYAGASIAGTETHVLAQNKIYNQGLINGELTHLQADQIENDGAKIYGTQVSIQASRLDNHSNSTDTGAVIASRADMDLGIKVLDNHAGGKVSETASDNAWIFSTGTLSIGGKLDSNYQATGSADAIYNRSSRIESMEEMQLKAGTILNNNENFTTIIEQVGPVQKLVYIQPRDTAGKIPSTELYWQNWSRAGLYRYKMNQDVLPENVVLGSTAIPHVETTTCTGSGDDQVCAINYKNSDLVWKYFKIIPPSEEPALPVLTEPQAPTGQSNCDAATYNDQACKAYNKNLQIYQVDKKAYDQEQLDYAQAVEAWRNSDQSAYQLLDEAVNKYNEKFSSAEIKAWTQYDVDHSEYETRIVTSAPAEMIAGGNMNITADMFTNDKSHVIVGKALTATVGKLNNIDGEGLHIIKETGTSQYTNSRWRGGFKRYHQRDWGDKVAYEPADITKDIKLPVNKWQNNAANATQQYQVGQLNTGNADQYKAAVVNAAGTKARTTQQASNTHTDVSHGLAATVQQGQTDQPTESKMQNIQNGLLITKIAKQLQQLGALQDLNISPIADIHQDTLSTVKPGDMNPDFVRKGVAAAENPDGLTAPAAPGRLDLATQKQQLKNVDSTQNLSVDNSQLKGTGDQQNYEIRTLQQDTIKVPANALFIVHAASQSKYLVETDPSFANYNKWLSSDYMLNALGLNPGLIEKRVGDGYYEQRLVHDQIANLTGRRFLQGYASDEEQYKALMNNGLTFARTWYLRPGVALSAEQVAQLTTDIVWLEEKTVVLKDGSTTTALFPQIYVKAHAGDLKGDGTLISADSIKLNVSGDVLNSATIAGRQAVVLNANNVDILNGRIQANQVGVSTRENLNIIGGQIQTKDGIQLDVGHDFRLESSTSSREHKVGDSVFSYTGIDRVAGLYTTGAIDSNNLKTTISIHTGGSSTIKAAEIVNQKGGTIVESKGDLNIEGITTVVNNRGYANANNFNYEKQQKDIGSLIQSKGDLYLKGDNITVTGSKLSSELGNNILLADKKIDISEGRQVSDMEQGYKISNKGFFGSSSEQSHIRQMSDEAIVSVVDGNKVIMKAANIDIIGSKVISEQLTQLQAKENITINAAQNQYLDESEVIKKKSGFSSSFSDGVASVGYGKSSVRNAQDNQSTGLTQSQIVSINGNTNIIASKDLTTEAAIIYAGKDLNLQGANINLNAGQTTTEQQNASQVKQSGLSVGFTYSPVTAAKSAYEKSTESSEFSDSLVGQSMARAEGIRKASMAATTPIVVTAGSSKSEQNANTSTTQNVITEVEAKGNLNIIATEGSINSQGAKITAEGDALLHAKDNINLDLVLDTHTQTADRKRSGFSIDNRDWIAPVGTYNDRNIGDGNISKSTGTLISVGGKSIMQTEKGDINIIGSTVVSQGDNVINAAHDINIKSSQNSQNKNEIQSSKGWGSAQISDTERFDGYMSSNSLDKSSSLEQQRSSVGSLAGNVNIQAGNKYTQQIADVVAAKDINITAKDIAVLEDKNSGSAEQSEDDLKVGVFSKVSSPLIDLANAIDGAKNSKADDRTKALQGLAAGAQGYQTYSDIKGGALFKAEAGIGFKTSESEQRSQYTESQQNNIKAGGNVNLTSTAGNIHLQNTNVTATDNISLDSAKDILLESGQSQLKADGSNSNAGLSIGYGFSVGAQTGVYIYGEAGYGKGSNHTDNKLQNNTRLESDQLNIHSQGDTTLKGAQATANRIDADVDGKLSVISTQDTVDQQIEQMGVGGRVQVSLGTAWQVSGNYNSSEANGQSNSVQQQSGLFAGDGGYHVKADSVDLQGGAIASTASKDKNELTANSLMFSNIENQSAYDAKSVSLAGGTSGTNDKADSQAGTPTNNDNWRNATSFSPSLPQSESDKDRSTTYATLSEGNITIGGQATTTTALGINSNVNTANTAVETLPNLQEILDKQKTVADATSTIAAATRTYNQNQQKQAEAEKEAQKQQVLSKIGQNSDALGYYQNLDPVKQEEYLRQYSPNYAKASQSNQDWGMGGDKSRAVNAVTMAVTGALGGQTDLQVAANTLAPYAANVIGKEFGHGEDNNTAAQLVSHAILGAALAYVNGGDPTAGGSAAVASEAAATYFTNQYKDDARYQNDKGEFIPNLLPEDVKTQIRDLTAAIGAVVGGTVGDSAFEAQLAGVVGQNAVENNYLSPEEYKRKVELINKAQGGENGLNFKVLAILNNGSLNEKEAREFLALVAMDKYSDQLLKQYVKNPKSLSNEQLYDLTYLLNQASNGDPKKAQQIYTDAKFNIGTADPYTSEQLNKAIIKAKQSLSYANSTDKQLAEAAEPALFGLTGKLGTAIRYVGGLAGSYNVGQGSAKIADGEYSEGTVQIINGALMIVPAIAKQATINTSNSVNVFDNKFRTVVADKEAQKVLQVMDADNLISKNAANSVTVMTHKDGTVSIGISGDITKSATQTRIENLQKALDKKYGEGKYRVSTSTLDQKSGIVKINNGNNPGICGEAKCSVAAGTSSSEVTGFATVWRGTKNNPYPMKSSNNGLSSNQMDFCPTCKNPSNQAIYSKEASKHLK